MAAPIEWSELPDIALIYIYYEAADQDRLSMALTCKNWHRLFSSAVLWRHRRVVFDSDSAEQTAEKEIQFLDKFGHCLYKLSINIGTPNFKTCMAISKATETYVTRICGRNDIRLRELELESLHLEQNWRFILSRNRLVTALCHMIRKQRRLKTMYMAGARMRMVDGCRVLEALVKGTNVRTITNIYVEDFFETNVIPHRAQRYVSALSKFSSLQYIHINYKYLNGEVLRNFANKLGRKLESLSLILEGDIQGLEIPTDVWVEFAQQCPLAEVGMYLCTTILRGHDLRTPFVRGLPLNNVYLTSWSRADETEFRLAALLRHLGHLYNTSLESFAMFFEQHEHLDVELLFMLRRCRHLQDLSVLAHISADTIIDIMNLQHQRRLALRSINLTISGLTDADWSRIDAEKERLLATVGDFVYVGPNENDSSDSGSSTITLGDDVDAVDAVDENIGAENAFAVELNNIEIHIEDEDAIFGPPRNPYHDDDDNFLL